MANIKDLKKRIRSTKNTLKITTAMKLVSAAKLARAQGAITSSRPYSNELNTTIKTVSALVDGYSHEYLEENKENNLAHLLIISSDKGLCGAYNNQLVKKVRAFLAENDQYKFKVHYIGKKAKELIRKEVNSGEHFTFSKAEPTFNEVRDVAKKLSNDFSTKEVGKVFVAYNVFNSAISFTSTVTQVLPMVLPEEEKRALKEKFPFDFKYEPNPSEILDTLIPESYVNVVYTAVLDAIAAEHGSRMSAMENASKNSKEMIRTLTIKMNKLRQASITTELSEIVSGAEALNG